MMSRARAGAWWATCLCLVASGCSLLVPSPDDFTYGTDTGPQLDASLDLDAGRPDAGDPGTADAGASDGGSEPLVVEQLETGPRHACAIVRGEVWCWGDNRSGQCATEAPDAIDTPRATGVTSAIDLAVGAEHTCALLETEPRRIQCWGNNTRGQLARGTVNDGSANPLDVAGFPAVDGVTQIDAGAFNICARTNDGDVYCWGSNASGALSTATTDPNSPVPLRIPDAADALAVAVGTRQVCYRTQLEVYCWGQFDRPIGMPQLTPIVITEIFEPTTIDMTADTACSLLADGSTRCWGADGFGQLGGRGASYEAAVEISLGGVSVADVRAGTYHACVRTAGGEVQC